MFRSVVCLRLSFYGSNKAVLLSTPDLPLFLLFVQLIIAVILLHVGTIFTSKVEIPAIDLHTARKLTPVVLINIVGLVFNMLCLRDVEASFFQVSTAVTPPRVTYTDTYRLRGASFYRSQSLCHQPSPIRDLRCWYWQPRHWLLLVSSSA